MKRIFLFLLLSVLFFLKASPSYAYDCANKDPRCADATTYTTCVDFGTANYTCPPPNCVMENGGGIFGQGPLTHSCAYNKDQPAPGACNREGGSCFGTFGSSGQGCCVGFICENPGVGGSTGTGVCRATPASLNGCIQCPNGTWNGTQCTGNPTTGIQVNCGTSQECVMGEGCVAPPPPLPSYGGAFGGAATTLSCGTGINDVWTLSCIFPLLASLVYWLLMFAGAVATFFVIFAGIRLTTSGGDPKTVEVGKKTLTFAIGGLVLVLLAFLILNLIGDVTGLACIKPSTPLSFQSCQ